MNYFVRSRSLETGRRRFHILAMRFHPDKGGAREDFEELVRQWKQFQADCAAGKIPRPKQPTARAKRSTAPKKTGKRKSAESEQKSRRNGKEPYDRPEPTQNTSKSAQKVCPAEARYDNCGSPDDVSVGREAKDAAGVARRVILGHLRTFGSSVLRDLGEIVAEMLEGKIRDP